MELDGFSGVMLALGAVYALANCFFGYRLQRVWIAAVCFLTGFGAGAAVCAQMGAHTAVSVLAGLAFGVVLVLLSFKLYLAGVFLFTGGLTLLLCRLLIETQWLGWTVGLLAGVLIGAASVRATRVVMILVSAVSGGFAAGRFLLGLMPAALAQQTSAPVLAGCVLAAAGMVFQFVTTRKYAAQSGKPLKNDTKP